MWIGYERVSLTHRTAFKPPGFLRFDHFRVPRRAMLMRHAKLDEDGTYHPPPVAKAAYGTMVYVRADIVQNAALFLKKAVTIAVRYNSVRRQSTADPTAKGREKQVLDYGHAQRTLLPLVATAYAFHFTAIQSAWGGGGRSGRRTAVPLCSDYSDALLPPFLLSLAQCAPCTPPTKRRPACPATSRRCPSCTPRRRG